MTFIAVPVIKLQFTKPISLILFPLTPIFDFIFVNLLSLSELVTINPVSLIDGELGLLCVLVEYFNFPITVSFALSEFALVCKFSRHELIPLTSFFSFSGQMHLPLSEVKSTIKVPQNVVALTIAEIYTVFIFLHNHLHFAVAGDGDAENLKCQFPQII